ncbi:MAG: rhodanese-like domain-containing protein [Muricauda sp. TMED12]|nr:MAG: rhodanese-like domain-containing protein [Muricauda sp. TMED12]|tara:strand:+ start:1318 stop:1698 length:381 start_codon:yes stop_codon:yes gene_type:complete
MRNIWMVFSLVLFMGVSSCQSQESATITKVDNATIKQDVIGKNVQLVDVRTPEEYNSGHIDDAVNFDLSRQKSFLEQINTLDKDKPVYLYCAVGSRSAYAAKILEREGFTKIFDYSGGYMDWVRNQ